MLSFAELLTRNKYERIQNSALHPFGVFLALLERYVMFRTSENYSSRHSG
jgi:hypothetical protein